MSPTTRRAKRLTLGVMAVGLAVVVALAIAHWDTARDHLKAWHFQLTRDTVTVDPGPSSENQDPTKVPLVLLASLSGCPVICEEPGIMMSWSGWLKADHELSRAATSTDEMLRFLRQLRFRVLEQRFPRHVYVVIRDEAVQYIQDLEVNSTGMIPFPHASSAPSRE